MNLSQEAYEKANGEVETLLEKYRSTISKDSVAHIEHYLHHDELEMAFESLALSVIEEHIEISEPDQKIMLQLGITLEVESNSVFDGETWNKLVAAFTK